MHSIPTAQLIAAGRISDIINLYKETIQGCPLSLLLSNLGLEPLSRFLNTLDPLNGIRVGKTELCTALFADDILVFTSQPAPPQYANPTEDP